MKPYTQFLKESSRSIWLLCHNEKLEKIEKLMKKTEMKLLPIYHHIQLSTNIFKEKELVNVKKIVEKLIKKKIYEVRK